MLEPAVIVLRLLQYLAVAAVFGSSLFLLYALPASAASALSWPRRLILAAALVLACASGAGLVAQTVVMAGSASEGLKSDSLRFVAFQTGLGIGALVRATAAAAAAAMAAFLPPSRTLWLTAAACGFVAALSVPWMGHGAATEGARGVAHLVSDTLHVLAAAVWLGALFAFLGMAMDRRARVTPAYPRALRGFGAIGTAAVLLLLATGLGNSWFLVGPERAADLLSSPYGRILAAKLLLFGLMLGMAALNRFRLAPALAAATGSGAAEESLSRMKASLTAETVTGIFVLLAAAWLGVLIPPAAGE